MWARGQPKYNSNALVKQSDCAPPPPPIVTRMTRTGLEKLVAKLKCGQQPWPLDFKQKLVEPCSRKKQKWPPPVVLSDDEGDEFWRENDENRGVKRKKSIMAPSIKRFKPLVELEPEPELELEEVVVPEKEEAAAPQDSEPSKDEFMLYFNLNGRRDSASSSSSNWCKFNHCTNIPFSSDVGRAMAAREHHHMPEDLKMRRLERTEWYINKPVPLRSHPGDGEYEAAAPRKEVQSHQFKMPKRQMHHKRWSIYQVDFLAGFCKPASVVLERLDLTQLPQPTRPDVTEQQQQQQQDLLAAAHPTVKELKVVIENAQCCVNSSKRKMRTSPRLKSTEIVRNCC